MESKQALVAAWVHYRVYSRNSASLEPPNDPQGGKRLAVNAVLVLNGCNSRAEDDGKRLLKGDGGKIPANVYSREGGKRKERLGEDRG